MIAMETAGSLNMIGYGLAAVGPGIEIGRAHV